MTNSGTPADHPDTLHIYNTLTGRMEQFTPINGRQVSLYICGPTVYDSAHLGHARTYVCFDVIRRILENHFGYEVTYVMNITDVDDKIIRKADGIFSEFLKSNVKYVRQRCANRKKKASNDSSSSESDDEMDSETRREAFSECVRWLARKYEDEFMMDMCRLGVRTPTFITRVTEYIPQIIAFIARLVEMEKAYVSNGSVYFDMQRYLKDGHVKYFRRETDDTDDGTGEKRCVMDFSLWKRASDTDLFAYASPWSRGRPGWHIECSAMAMDILGPTLDMHAGGIDLQFPHHENEMIQSVALTGKHFVNTFVHTGHLHIEGHKMSKSLKNFITIGEALKQMTPRQMRMMFLSTAYGSTVTYKNEAIEYAQRMDSKIFNWISMAEADIARRMKERTGNASDGRTAGSVTVVHRINHIDQYISTINNDGPSNCNDSNYNYNDYNDNDIDGNTNNGNDIDGNVVGNTNNNNDIDGNTNNDNTDTNIITNTNTIITDNDTISGNDDSDEYAMHATTCMYGPLTSSDHMVLNMLTITKQDVHTSFCDNFNTFKTLTAIHNMITVMHQKMPYCTGQTVQAVLAYVKKVLAVLGLEGREEVASGDALPQLLCTFRNEVRRVCREKGAYRDIYRVCDAVRDDLSEMGYIIEDSGTGSSIRRRV